MVLPRVHRRNPVSIHTLHELEASRELGDLEISNLKEIVSIHTLHELEASAEVVSTSQFTDKFPFIRFTNWKQE